ncbi:MAG: HlyD family efflux transporter periplasmic adaptor subunit [Lachnospiraceae bacterium]|nr:HlyD family efflux transporter periplasmic adaptor subunit [Lachnospiraceae bacterium]
MKKGRIHLSLSLVIFLILLIYMIVNVLTFVFKTKLTVYEVQAGIMTDKISTTGIAIREEEVIKSKSGGYINYYIPDLSKVYKGEILYSLDTTGEIKNYIAEEITENKKASNKAISSLNDTITAFKEDYTYSQFEDVYSLKQKLDNAVLSSNGEYIEKTLNKIQKKYGKDAYQIKKSGQSGVVSFTYDNFKRAKADDITESDFEQNKYEQNHLSSNNEISAGDEVYRIVDSEDWQIVILLDKDEYNELKDRDNVNITFLQDGVTTSAGIEVKKKDNHYFGYLSLSKYMVRYMNDRYLELEISLGSDSGYKIPKSSIVEKDFYRVPVEYLTKGGNSTANCVLAKSGKEKTASTKNYTIYKFEADKDKYFYLSADEVQKNTVLFSDSDINVEQYFLEKKVKKQGVYSVNQGYAKFRAIEKLKSDDEFVLIATDTVQGISLYDRIVYESSDIDENDAIY